MRVISSLRKVTGQRDEAEGACDVAVIALNAIQRSANLALLSDLDGARGIKLQFSKLITTAQLLFWELLACCNVLLPPQPKGKNLVH